MPGTTDAVFEEVGRPYAAVGEEPWAVEDWIKAVKIRLRPVLETVTSLFEATSEIHQAMWPGRRVPKTLRGMAARMRAVPARFQEWKDSAARQASLLTLEAAASWHSGFRLDRLSGRRKLAEGEVPEHSAEALLKRACFLADRTPVDDFLADPSASASHGGQAAEPEEQAGSGRSELEEARAGKAAEAEAPDDTSDFEGSSGSEGSGGSDPDYSC